MEIEGIIVKVSQILDKLATSYTKAGCELVGVV